MPYKLTKGALRKSKYMLNVYIMQKITRQKLFSQHCHRERSV